MSITYKVVHRTVSHVRILIMTMDPLVRGKYPNSDRPLFSTHDGYKVCSHYWPCYYEDRHTLFLPGNDTSADSQLVSVPNADWDGVQRVLSAIGAMCIDPGECSDPFVPFKHPLPGVTTGLKPLTEVLT